MAHAPHVNDLRCRQQTVASTRNDGWRSSVVSLIATPGVLGNITVDVYRSVVCQSICHVHRPVIMSGIGLSPASVDRLQTNLVVKHLYLGRSIRAFSVHILPVHVWQQQQVRYHVGCCTLNSAGLRNLAALCGPD